MHFPKRQGFTLIELITVVAVIAILAAILIPVVAQMRAQANLVNCSSNLRQLHTAAMSWSTENDGLVIPSLDRRKGENGENWPKLLLGVMAYPNWDEFRVALACNEYEGNRNGTFWMLGYALNETPAYLGDSSDLPKGQTKRQLSRIDDDGTGPRYRLNEVTFPARRLLFCDSNQWHIGENNSHDSADYHRHGPDRCNAIFFDGHIELLTPTEIDRSVSEPGLRLVAADEE